MEAIVPESRIYVVFAADPYVVELHDQKTAKAKLQLEVYGVEEVDDLEITLLPPVDPEGFHIEAAGKPTKSRAAGRPSAPVRVTLPLRCERLGDRGREATTRLELRVRLREPQAEPPTAASAAARDDDADVFAVGLTLAADRKLPLWQVLREEYLELARDKKWRRALETDPVLTSPKRSDREKLQRVLRMAHDADPGLTALCFSGGGIRSATFNLGILQGLADAGLLSRFDYLSSVSGGGYISSWLAGWIKRSPAGVDDVAEYLEELDEGAGANVEDPEPYPVRFLRRYSNYLTPRLGALSADTWTVAAMVVRNMILNWLVLVPILAAALALPLLALVRVPWAPPAWLPYVLALAAGTVGQFFMSVLRASAEPKGDATSGRWTKRVLRLGLLPVLLAVALLAWAAYLYQTAGGGPWPADLVWSALWALGVPLVGFLLGHPLARTLDRPRPSLVGDLVALLLSGAVTTGVYFAILEHWVPGLVGRPVLYTLLAPILVLGPLLLGKSLFVAFSSVAEDHGYPSDLGDADREWWARWSGWMLISTVVWTGGAAIAYFAPLVLDDTVDRVAALISAGGLGTLASQLGKSASTGRLKQVALALAAPLFVVALLLLVAAGTQSLFAAVLPSAGGLDWPRVPPFHGYLLSLAGAIALLAVIGILVGRAVNVNRFSLQAMYRNRLVRAYLGASNSRRRPNLFTGFDPHDDLRLHQLRGNRPWPVVNIALNLVRGEDLAWQQRKAESFTATPLHCGAARLGYRRSQVYGGDEGLSLGTAVATSGAAASPNMGYHSSPAITFIMALFNARLGAWLGNPGKAGTGSYTRSGPADSAYRLVAEALGKTGDREPYVYLSDGGHFENLGLYEMVRRRCRIIVACDAGCDPQCFFDDLGNAIRKIRIDLGVPIRFDDRIAIYPKPVDGKVAEGAAYCAVGTIDYSAVDGSDAEGHLVYVKPAIIDEEPYDVTNYARRSKDFPHEGTADQWFSESQFESYRALGKNVLAKLIAAGPNEPRFASLDDLKANVERYLRKPRAGETAAELVPGEDEADEIAAE